MPHPLCVSRLRRSASFRRLTGVDVATFDRMLQQLRAPWQAAQRRKRKSGRPWEVGGLEDHLLIMLLYYRCYVTQEFIGVFWQVDRSVICRAIRRMEACAKPLFGVRRAPKVSRREAEAHTPPSLQAQGGQSRPLYFNNPRDIPARRGGRVQHCTIRRGPLIRVEHRFRLRNSFFLDNFGIL